MGPRRSKDHAIRRSTYLRFVFAALGVALIAVLVARLGPHAIFQQLNRAGPGVVWVLVPYAVGTAIGAFPWAWLLPRSVRPPVGAVIGSRFAASGANSLLPFFGLAGEPSRLLWLPGTARADGLAAIVVDRVLYNSASALLLLIAAIAAFGNTRLPRSVTAVAVGIALATLGATLVGAWAAARFGIGHRIQALLLRVLGKHYGETEFGSAVDAAIVRLVRGPKQLLCLDLVVHLAGRAAIATEVYVALWALDAPVSPMEAVVLGVVPIALAPFASWIPSQLGVQEGAQTLIAGALGLAPAVGFSLVLLQRIRQLAFVGFTPLLIAAAHPSRDAKILQP